MTVSITPDLQFRMHDVLSTILAERGSVVLFAMLERTETPDRWDVVISADWIGDDDVFPVIEYFFNVAEKHLTKEDLGAIARVVPLRPDADFVKLLREEYDQPFSTNGSAKHVVSFDGSLIIGGVQTPHLMVLLSSKLKSNGRN